MNINTSIFFGLNDYLSHSNLTEKKIFLYASDIFREHKSFQKFINDISIVNELTIAFKDFRGEPTTDFINKIKYNYDANYDLIIGIGGGSVLDICKFLSFIFNSQYKSEDFDINGNGAILNTIPLTLIPTTSGSGSEVTKYCVASNSLTKRKFTVSNYNILPHNAVIETSFLLDIPLYIRLSSTLDAFIHCYEAFLNHDLDEVSKILCIKALDDICIGINSYDKGKINRIAYGSLIAGSLINNYRTGLIHTISVALSEYTNLAHGMLNTYLFKYVHNFNLINYENNVNLFRRTIKGYLSENIISNVLQISDGIKVDYHTKPDKDKILTRISQDRGLMGLNVAGSQPSDVIEILDILL